MIEINYKKRKNTELFKSLEEPSTLYLSNIQNYIPIYNRFFSLNDTNYNNINLNNKWNIINVNENMDDIDNLYKSVIQNTTNNVKKIVPVFFKMAPLLDPFKFLCGNHKRPNDLLNLPKLSSTVNDINEKLIDVNNSAYVDGMFLFLSSTLIHTHSFIHGVDYYGSFLAIKNDFKLNIFDDIDYLSKNEFFNKNKNILFKIDDENLFMFNQINVDKKPIIIHDTSIKSALSIQSIDDSLFENLFGNQPNCIEGENITTEFNLNEIDMFEFSSTDDKTSLKSNSTCSSRTSHTSISNLYVGENEFLDELDNDYETKENGNILANKEDVDKVDADELNNVVDDNEDDNEDANKDDNEDDNEDDDENDDEILNVIIPKFPVQVIGMEFCEDTLDNLIMTEELTNDEWYSILMQIIMILITYQKAFAFTHNDLHTNNVMYIPTNKKFMYYQFNNKIYKVPTFGRIIKIIDFGRSIYKFNGKTFCSDSYKIGGDASSQYNIEPYLNEKKPRLEPNFSFDLCRLACAMFDFMIDDTKINDPIKKLIIEWCLDDKGLNMLYKTNGQERYPEFKLYKMIARCVHNHTPQAQLNRPEFSKYVITEKLTKTSGLINIDKIPSFV
jgi:hypothetical protein